MEQKRRSTGQGTKSSLDHQWPEKMDSRGRMQPRAFAPQVSAMASGVQDDVSHEYAFLVVFQICTFRFYTSSPNS
jgi:hypothetical protein